MSKRQRTFITVITQIKTFFLNLGTANKKLEATKCSLERFFQKELEHQKNKKKLFFLKFFRKSLRPYLKLDISKLGW